MRTTINLAVLILLIFSIKLELMECWRQAGFMSLMAFGALWCEREFTK